MQITLYSTDGCHLCEQAIGMFYYAKQQGLFKVIPDLTIVDIVESEALVSDYGESIPVFHCSTEDKSLYWPIELTDLVDWINACC